MPSLNYNIEDVNRFLGLLSWNRIFLLIIFLFIIGLTWATYENREVIYGYASQKRIEPTAPLVQTLSKATAGEIDAIVNKSEIIVGMNVTLADFQKNQRRTIYRSIEMSELKSIFEEYSKNSIGNLPLFNEDVGNNHLIVELINGEFTCRPVAETMTGKLVIGVNRYISTICMNGIPASYGKFTGIISVHLKRVPTNSEYDQLRSITRGMATLIYEKDLSGHYRN